MKAITIKNPYAWLIMAGLKKYETRSWDTAHRGLMAIHAGKQKPRMNELNQAINRVVEVHKPEFAYGAILGIVELVETYQVTNTLLDIISPFERQCGYWDIAEHTKGYAWKLRVVEVFSQPIPAIGKLGRGIGKI